MMYRLMYNGELNLFETSNKNTLAASIVNYVEKNGGSYSNFSIRIYETEQALKEDKANRLYSLDGWATLQTFEMQANS